MASPFASHPGEIDPRVLRPTFQTDVMAGGGVIGGGYALHVEGRLASAGGGERRILTRLSDGHYWVLAPRAGRDWGEVLYVDHEELAMVENVPPPPYTATAWTIVRRSIASLGPPLPPGSGFDLE